VTKRLLTPLSNFSCNFNLSRYIRALKPELIKTIGEVDILVAEIDKEKTEVVEPKKIIAQKEEAFAAEQAGPGPWFPHCLLIVHVYTLAVSSSLSSPLVLFAHCWLTVHRYTLAASSSLALPLVP